MGLFASKFCPVHSVTVRQPVDQIGTTEDGRAFLQEKFKLCAPLKDHAAVQALVRDVSGVFFDLSEAN